MNQPKQQSKSVKLNEQKVLAIRTSLKSGVPSEKLAKIYKVHRSTISDIKNRTTWKQVGGPKLKKGKN